MKSLIYLLAAFLLIWEPAHLSKGQTKGKILPVKLNNENLKKTVQANQDTIRNLIKAAEDIKPKIIVKYRYRTKIKVVYDTLYVAIPFSMDSSFVMEDCPPPDTVYIDRPILVRKKNFFDRIF